MYRAAALLWIGLLVALPAAADRLAGAWSFETQIRKKGCTITGNMAIGLPDEDGRRSCNFVSTETCDWNPEAEGVTVDQSCRIIPQGKFYLFTSTVEQTLTPTTSYMADHFTVKPDGKNRLVGQWYDKLYRDRVVFERNRDAPIS